MKFAQLIQKSYELFPAIIVENLISHIWRKRLRKMILTFIAISLFVMILGFAPEYIFNIRGFIFILFSLWIFLYLLDALYFSYYFAKDSPMDFEVAKIIYDTDNDITKGFVDSEIGKFVLLRLGINNKEIERFLNQRTDVVTVDEFLIVENDSDPYISISEYARSILHFDIEFAKFLKSFGVDGNTWKGALDWVSRNQKKYIEREAWWHRDRLSRIPSIGRDWSYGQVYSLQKYGRPIFEDPIFQNISTKLSFFEDDVNNLERILSKSSGANILLVAEQVMLAKQLVCALGKEIENGTVRNEIEGKRVYVLDTESIIDAMKEKTEFEIELNSILAQVAHAGNIILIVPDLPSFIVSSNAIDVDIKNVLGNALSSERIQMIAISGSSAFHETVETSHDFTQYFEKIMISDLDYSAVIEMIETEANIIESTQPVFFSYQSLIAVVKSAERFFADDSLYDKSVDLLNEVVTASIKPKTKINFISQEQVENIIEKRTGIPQGEIDADEQIKLSQLENILHQRIVGQDLAISSISSAIRRARAGLSDTKRPMGSFMFLGPTGVGKTETTKALSETFFGSEDKIIRVDMSEYTTDDALEKLIGSFENKQIGFLAAKLRESQYGVLLLDEFEKSSKKVQDLFLQVLDEGYFTDGRGERVNARNLIIIATSNAGSDLIYEASRHGQNSLNQQNILDQIIKRGIFRPELLNRFDGVILFHPLGKDVLQKVAVLILESLNKRLSDKNISIKINDFLINHLVEIGTNLQFGARAMKRSVQDVVEKIVADAIIKGEVSNGDNIEFYVSEQSLKVKKV